MNSSEAHRLYTHIIAAAGEVYSQLGPGLNSSVYIKSLGLEFDEKEMQFRSHVPVSLVYKNYKLNESLFIDILIENGIILMIYDNEENKNFEELQLRSILKLTKLKFGIMINFKTERLLDGIKKIYSS